MVHDTQPHPTHMHNHLSQTQAELALQVCIDLTDAYVKYGTRDAGKRLHVQKYLPT